MKITINEPLIRRNKKIGQICTIASLIVLAGGLVLSFQKPTSILFTDSLTLSFAALILGFVLSQIGIFYSNRWGRSPRPDEMINQSLKGLDDQYSLIHYQSPASHLLIGPSGIWTLLPYYQGGTITFSKGRYHQKGGGFFMKLFGQENLGRPELEAEGQISDIRRQLEKRMEPDAIPPIQAALIFTNPKATLEVEESPYPVITPKKIKDIVRKKNKTGGLTPEKIVEIEEILIKK